MHGSPTRPVTPATSKVSPTSPRLALKFPRTAGVIDPEIADSPGPVPCLSSPTHAHDPPSRSAAGVAKNPHREGVLSTHKTGSCLQQHPAPITTMTGSPGEPTAGRGHSEQELSPRDSGSARCEVDDGMVDDGMVEIKLLSRGAKTPCNPELWRALMVEGVVDDSTTPHTFVFRGRTLKKPVYGADGLATVRDALSGEAFYVGPGRHEVFPPKRVAAGVEVVKQVMAWANVHGWHDLPRRLLEQGTTDYSLYAPVDQEMVPIGPSDSKMFSYRGRTLQLCGPSRWDPKKLLDAHSGEVLWDYSTANKLRFPWARQALEMLSDHHHLSVHDRISKKLLVKLELACWPDLGSPNALSPPRNTHTQQTTHASPRDQPPHIPTDRPVDRQTGRDSGTQSAVVEAVVKLKEWAEQKGWFDLDTRLLQAGTTDYKTYGEMERRMHAVHDREGVFTLDGRTIQVCLSGALQCVAVCCSVLQCVAVCCRVLQRLHP